jgi:rSAM-partnered protein
MVKQTNRTDAPNGPRAADGRRFEVFVRETEADPLRHVGTVAAPTPDTAHERADAIFGYRVRDVWVCPAEEMRRYSAESLAGDGASTSDCADPSERDEGPESVPCGGASAKETGGAR